MARLFGTDGVRGIANIDVTPELAVALAVATTEVFTEAKRSSHKRPTAVIGRDSRVSGQMLSAALAAGLASAGVDVLDVGVIPTPGVAHLVAATDADFGAVVSASHNPMADNGIKFFARGGHKVDDTVEESIEEHLGRSITRPTGEGVGTITLRPDLLTRYVTHVVDAVRRFSGRAAPLEGLTIVADCAHGAASTVASEALQAAGATAIIIHAEPNGLNINDGVGSTHIDRCAEAVVEHSADLGVAFDGDADRCLAVDHLGDVVDGDQIMGLLAQQMKSQGLLYRDTIVATVMSNLGLHKAMRRAGIDIVETAVGDRYVLEAMREAGYSLGGEQSGHIILSDFSTTGDGLLTALLVGSILTSTSATLRDQVASIEKLPQVLINVPNVDKSRVFTDEVVETAVADARDLLGADGRVLLRPSGTEPLVRVMVEAGTRAQAEEVATVLVAVVTDRLAIT